MFETPFSLLPLPGVFFFVVTQPRRVAPCDVSRGVQLGSRIEARTWLRRNSAIRSARPDALRSVIGDRKGRRQRSRLCRILQGTFLAVGRSINSLKLADQTCCETHCGQHVRGKLRGVTLSPPSSIVPIRDHRKLRLGVSKTKHHT